MKAQDLYRDTLKELDKYGSPTFTIRDFNYFANSAVSEYINENYKKLDIKQKESDDLRFFISTNQLLTVSVGGAVNLPSNYRHMLGIFVTVKFIKDIGRYKTNDVVQFPVERLKSGQKGFRSRNAFGKPSFNRYYYDVSGTVLTVYFDATYVKFEGANNAKIDYIGQPSDIYLNPDRSSDYTQAINNSTLVFAPLTVNQIYFEVAKKLRDLFLENIESPRVGTAVQQSAARQE